MSIELRISQELSSTINQIKLTDQEEKAAVTLESLDVNTATINEIFNETVAENNSPANTTTPNHKALRDARKAVKKTAKKQTVEAVTVQKSKNVYNNVVNPTFKQLKGPAIQELRFSQDSIDAKTSEGTPLDALKDNMSQAGWKKGTQICVVEMPDGRHVSLDNRRLFAAKQVATTNAQFSISANIFKHSDKAPPKLVRGIEGEFKKGRKIVNLAEVSLPEAITPETYGYAALLRINTRIGDLATSHFGYDSNPTIRNS